MSFNLSYAAADLNSAITKANAAAPQSTTYTKSETDTLLSGKASLVDGKVPSTQLPSYVDDVLEYSSTSAFPATGESGKIYVATDTNKTYRWSGSAYVEISESLALGETASTAYAGNKGKANADAIAKKPGEITTGKQYTIDGQTVTAGIGAEVFNDFTANKASGQYSHAEGISITASGYGSHAEGGGTTASGDTSHAEGGGTKASGNQSHAEGGSTIASGYASHAEGGGTTASGAQSHAEGNSTKASSANQHVQGKFNVEDANDTYAFIIGNGTGNNARHNAFAIDWNGLIYVNGASTGADLTKKPGEITTGKQYTIDEQAVTAGAGAEAFNDLSNNKPTGEYSHAEGSQTFATGGASHAEGNQTFAAGGASHAEGNNTVATGDASHAEGFFTRAAGTHSHAEGEGTSASGMYSHSQNHQTRAAGEAQTALGKYNIPDSTSAVIIGNGTDDDNRSNAMKIDWNGNVFTGSNTTSEQSHIAKAIDNGSKNLLYVEPGVTHMDNGITFTTNSDGTISYSGTASTTGYATYTIVTKTNTDGTLFKDCMLDSGVRDASINEQFIAIEGTASPYTKYALSISNATAIDSIPTGADIHVYVRVNCISGVAYSGAFKPMICTVSDWEASPAVVPYAPSNRELFEANQELSENKANNLKMTLIGSGSLDNISTNEFAVYTSAVTGKPQSGYAFVRTSVFDANAALQELTMLDGTYSGRSYVRVKNGGTWTTWRETTNN